MKLSIRDLLRKVGDLGICMENRSVIALMHLAIGCHYPKVLLK